VNCVFLALMLMCQFVLYNVQALCAYVFSFLNVMQKRWACMIIINWHCVLNQFMDIFVCLRVLNFMQRRDVHVCQLLRHGEFF